MTSHIDLATVTLDKGSHRPNDDAVCVMELVALFAHEPKTDHPTCTSPVLTAFAIAFNDGVDDATRQRLVPFIPRLVGTAGDPEADAVRAWMATDWLVRTFTPVWLRKAGLVEEADAIAALPELTTAALARAAQPIIDAARAKASAAGDAAGAAARAAARAAAGAAAGDAARAAAWAAAWDAAGAAAWAAAWDAAGAAARAAASKTKGGPYEAKYRAARKAADDILKPLYAETIIELRESALALFSRMIDARASVPA